jgi:hypothetical protein
MPCHILHFSRFPEQTHWIDQPERLNDRGGIWLHGALPYSGAFAETLVPSPSMIAVLGVRHDRWSATLQLPKDFKQCQCEGMCEEDFNAVDTPITEQMRADRTAHDAARLLGGTQH